MGAPTWRQPLLSFLLVSFHPAWGAFGAEAWAGCEVDATGVAIVLKKGRVIAGGR